MLERYDLGGFLPVLREAFRGDTEAPARGHHEWVGQVFECDPDRP